MKAGRIVAGLVVVAYAVGAASAAYQAIGETRDRRRNPAPGRLVDVGGYRLHIVCAGQGSPAVVIIPALGASTREWAAVQQAVAQESQVCVYDRAGIGWSDSPPRHRTAKRMADELHTLLHAAGVAPPYVLAGHSLGGLIALMFAHLYPGEMAGLALVDSSHPQQGERLPKTHLLHYPGGTTLWVVRDYARPLGLRRLARDLHLTAREVDWASHRRADSAELMAVRAICHATGDAADDLGDLPLAVITSAETDPSREPGSRRARARSRFYPGWVVLQDELAALSTDSSHVTAEHGGHHLNSDNAELVCEVITGLVERVRTATR
jgi:pimeloyl-ACP methyl ester carboxylesterase